MTKTIAELNAEIDSLLPTNNVGAIDASTVRTVLHDIVNNEQGGGGGGTFTGTGDPGLTRAQAIATAFSAPPNAIRTTGYAAAGDLGGGLHVKKNTAPTNHEGFFTTADGSFYVLVPEFGEINIAQFGALPMTAYNVEPAVGAAENCYAAWLRADKYIFYSGYSGITLRIPNGVYYTNPAWNLKRTCYRIVGSGNGFANANQGSYLRHNAYLDAININYHWGTGHDYSVYNNTFPWALHSATYWGGNLYRVITAGTPNISGSGPTGTGADIVDGTVHWKYEGPSGDLDVSTNTASGSQVENLAIWSFFDPTSLDTNVNKWPDQNNGYYACGIVVRVRALVRNVWTVAPQAHGIAVVADGDPEVQGAGNVNGWRVEDCSHYYSGKDGLHVGYADANAGSAMNIDTAQCGRWGIAMWDFLGNRYWNHQSAFDGNANAGKRQYAGGVLRNGYFWRARLPRIGVDGIPNYHNEPGTDGNAWIRWGGDGTLAAGSGGVEYPDWNNTTTYEPGGAFGANNANSRNNLIGFYIEGGTNPAQPGPLDIIDSGLLQGLYDRSKGAIILDDRRFQNQIQSQATFNSDSGVVTTFIAGLGSDSVNNYTAGTQPVSVAWFVQDWESNNYSLKGIGGQANLDWWLNDIWGWTGNTISGDTWNRGGALPGAKFQAAGRVLTTGGPSSAGRRAMREELGSAAPTSGFWGRGDKVWNQDPSASGTAGWICVTAGTPGTWKTFGTISA